ncbi:MAG TPA: class I SAM-dependent methyltransferase [Chryseolinea sp.]|nr:class I SAM-dependent methyltransferase [Chryseolinea sp.]
MEHSTAVRLIKDGVVNTPSPQVWAEFGAGTGTFTLALAELLPVQSTIYAVDKNESAVDSIRLKTPNITLKKIHGDFARTVAVPRLNGLLMANALHFISDKLPFISHLQGYLQTDGRIIFVEYERKIANPWVPYPITFHDLSELIKQSGFKSIARIGEAPSRFSNGSMYSAVVA